MIRRDNLDLRLRSIAIFIFFLFATVGSDAGFAQSPHILVVVDKLAFEDFVDFPEAAAMLTRRGQLGSVGLMNVRTEGPSNSANGFFSLSVGARRQTGSWAGHAFMADELFQGKKARTWYEGITGLMPDQPIVHLGIGEMKQRDKNPGIGAILSREGIVAAVVGNADTGNEKSRLATLIAMDGDGAVPMGDIGEEVNVIDAAFPGGIRTDYAQVLDRVVSYGNSARFIVVELGDLARLEHMQSVVSPDYATHWRKQSLQNIGQFIVDVVTHPHIDPSSVTLLSPSASTFRNRPGIMITPVMEWQPHTSIGLLTSDTTRRTGIVTNGDFLSTVLHRMNIVASPGLSSGGQPFRSIPRDEPLTAALTLYEKIKHVHLQRLPVIRPYFFGVLTIFTVGGLMLAYTFFRYRTHNFPWDGFNASFLRRYILTWRFVLTSFAAFPVALLFLSPLTPQSLAVTASILIALMAGLSVISLILEKIICIPSIALVATLTALVIMGDMFAQAPLMQGSLLGYDPVSGSRYYGIGNEYMGVLIGAALIGTGSLSDRWKMGRRTQGVTAVAVFILIASTFLHPRIGINVGGAIAALFTAGAAHAFSRDRTLTWKRGMVWAVAIVALIAAVAWVDFYFSQEKASHLGRVVQTVSRGGSDPLWALFGRKVAVNVRLIRLTIWSRVVFVAVAFLGGILFLPNRLLATMSRRHPSLTALNKAALVAALVTLVANDSGVVAAATLLLWPMLTVLTLAVELIFPTGYHKGEVA